MSETKIFTAKDHGVVPGRESGPALAELTALLAATDGPKELVFEPGEYPISAPLLQKEKYFITNTVANEEFANCETPHLSAAALLFRGINDLKVRGSGAVFVVDGRAHNLVISDCHGITIEDIELRSNNPDVHEFTVEKVTPMHAYFRLDNESTYEPDGKNFVYTGTDYKTSFFAMRNVSWGWFGHIPAGTPDHVEREMHPFAGALSIKEEEPRLFRLTYPSAGRFDVGEKWVIFGVRRENVGIFIERSSDVTLRRVKQRFSYSLALVAQDTDDITLEAPEFAPLPGTDRSFSSVADFMQFCMCRGKVSVTDGFFCGSGDDCLNVHGIHFSVKKIAGNELTVSFMHPQSHGFCPLRAGDDIEFIDPRTLLASGGTRITGVKMLNEFDILLTVADSSRAVRGCAIEDISACPELYFARNRMTRVITRGILVTTRGKSVIEDTDFDDTDLAAVLVSDDAKGWYESGCVKDLTIRRCRFGACGAYNVQILPENGHTGSVVHGRVDIEDNVFESPENGGIDAHGLRELVFENNTIKYPREDFIKTENVTVVKRGE